MPSIRTLLEKLERQKSQGARQARKCFLSWLLIGEATHVPEPKVPIGCHRFISRASSGIPFLGVIIAQVQSFWNI